MTYLKPKASGRNGVSCLQVLVEVSNLQFKRAYIQWNTTPQRYTHPKLQVIRSIRSFAKNVIHRLVQHGDRTCDSGMSIFDSPAPKMLKGTCNTCYVRRFSSEHRKDATSHRRGGETSVMPCFPVVSTRPKEKAISGRTLKEVTGI